MTGYKLVPKSMLRQTGAAARPWAAQDGAVEPVRRDLGRR